MYISKVGQNRIYTPCMTVYLAIPLPKIPYVHRIYIWFWPTLQIIFGRHLNATPSSVSTSLEPSYMHADPFQSRLLLTLDKYSKWVDCLTDLALALCQCSVGFAEVLPGGVQL